MSREADLYKDKIEVSLDGRQIFYLFFGGAVIVGLVFVLGVMVGRRVEARGHVDRARVAATVDPLAALDRLESGDPLSFQGALRGNDAPPSDVEKQIAAIQKADLAVRERPEKKAGKVAAQPAKPATQSASQSSAKPDSSAAAKTETKTETKSEAKPETKTETKTETKSEATSEAKATAPATAKKPDAGEPAQAEAKPKFTLQLSAFQDKREAEAYLASVKSAGYQAYVTEGAVDGKQYYRIRMGSYRSMDAANEAKAEFERTEKKSAIVTRL